MRLPGSHGSSCDPSRQSGSPLLSSDPQTLTDTACCTLTLLSAKDTARGQRSLRELKSHFLLCFFFFMLEDTTRAFSGRSDPSMATNRATGHLHEFLHQIEYFSYFSYIDSYIIRLIKHTIPVVFRGEPTLSQPRAKKSALNTCWYECHSLFPDAIQQKRDS